MFNPFTSAQPNAMMLAAAASAYKGAQKQTEKNKRDEKRGQMAMFVFNESQTEKQSRLQQMLEGHLA